MKAEQKIYQKVTDYLMAKIANGNMKLGEAIYSENELCKRLNVSRTSVRRAIREMVNNNILESRQGSGTYVSGLIPPSTICFVNHHTRSLRQIQADSYYTDFINSAERRVSENNSRFQIFSAPLTSAADIVKKTAILNSDAAIIDGNFQDYFDDMSVFKQAFQRCIILDGNPDETLLESVTVDLVPGFSEILQKAMPRQGRILFLYTGAIARRRWARDCFIKAANNLSLDSYKICDYTQDISPDLLGSIDHGYLMETKLDKILSGEKIKTIICASDRTAMRVSEYLKNHHYNIPDDIGISGVGGVEFSLLCKPQLTTIKIHTGQMAVTAVDLLLQSLRGHAIPRRTMIPAQMLDRNSLCQQQLGTRT